MNCRAYVSNERDGFYVNIKYLDTVRQTVKIGPFPSHGKAGEIGGLIVDGIKESGGGYG